MSIEKLSPEVLRAHQGLSYPGVVTGFFCLDAVSRRIFLAQRSVNCRDEHGRWDNGGGGLDFGLTAEKNVIHEIEEEYGATPLRIHFLGYRDKFRKTPEGADTHWLALDFAALVNPSEVHINEPHKFDDSGWFDMDNLPSPLHSQVQSSVDKYRDALLRIFDEL